MENQRVILFLNRLLANYFVLFIKTYRYQWFTKGTNTLTIKEQYRNIQHSLQLDIEQIAKHILYLNGKPFATMVKFIKQASLEEAEADDTIAEISNQTINDCRKIIREIEEEGIPLAKKTNDLYTIHFLLDRQTTIISVMNDMSMIN